MAACGSIALVALGLAACNKEGGAEEDEQGASAAGNGSLGPKALSDEKSKFYNLIGRWYPVREVNRLRDPSLTPEQWCERPPIKVVVLSDSVEVSCDKRVQHNAAIARVVTSSSASNLSLVLRAGVDSPLKQLRFRKIAGPHAVIEGSPCGNAKAEPYQRFPEYEILTRHILGGRRCAQLETLKSPSDDLTAPIAP